MDSPDEGAISSPIYIQIMQIVYETATSREKTVCTCQGMVKKKLLCNTHSGEGREGNPTYGLYGLRYVLPDPVRYFGVFILNSDTIKSHFSS